MTPSELNLRLIPNLEDICRELLPQGKRDGAEWRVASVEGGSGKSMGVHLTGAKAGVWADFATGQGGDILDLYEQVKQVPFKDVIKWAKDYLGIQDEGLSFRPDKQIVLKKTLSEHIDERVVAWFRKRGIDEKALAQYKISSEGTKVAFPSYKNGKLMFVKYRDIGRPKDQAFSAEPGAAATLIGWQGIPDDAREVVITEGEPDALSYATQGMPALSVPFGGGGGDKQGKWIENDYDDLQRFDTIYISMDMDKPGQEAVAAIVPRLGRHRCRIVVLPKKDANDTLQAGHILDDYLRAAQHLDPQELKPASSFIAEVHRIFEGAVDIAGDCLPWERTHDKFRMRPGEMTVWQGINGHGKSLVLSHIMSELICQPVKVCVASMEMRPVVLLRRAYQQIGAEGNPAYDYIDKINEYCMGNLHIVDIHGTAKADKLLELFQYAVLRFGCKHFIVDSLAKCGMAEDDYNGQKAFVEKLSDFAGQHLVHVHLVAHARKREDENHAPNKMDVKGTGAITDMVDNVISVWRNKPKEECVQKLEHVQKPIPSEVADKPDCILNIQKQRNYDWEGKIMLWFDKVTHQYLEWHCTAMPIMEEK